MNVLDLDVSLLVEEPHYGSVEKTGDKRQKGCTRFLRSLDIVDDEVRSRWTTLFAFLAVMDDVWYVNHTLYDLSDTAFDYLLNYIITCVLLCFIMLLLVWANNPKLSRKYSLYNAMFAFLFFINSLLVYEASYIPNMNSEVPRVITFISVLGSGFLVLSHLWTYVWDKNFAEERRHRIEFAKRLPVQAPNIDDRRELKLPTLQKIQNFLWPKSDLEMGQDFPVPTRIWASIAIILVASTYATYTLENDDEALDWIDLHSYEDHAIRSFRIALYITWIYSFYICAVIYLAWRKKVLELWYKAPTFHYDPTSIEIGDSFRLVGTIVFYLASGLVFLFFLLFICLALVTHPDFWDRFIFEYAFFLLGWLAYFLIFHFLINPFLQQNLTDGKYVRRGKETQFKFFSLMFELFYIPLAPLYALEDVLKRVVLLLVAFIRPDVICFPRGMEKHDKGHNVFVASVKLYINRIKQLYWDFPRTDDLDYLNRVLTEQRQKLHEHRDRQEWLHCDRVARYIKKVRGAIQVAELKLSLEVGEEIRLKRRDRIIVARITKINSDSVTIQDENSCFPCLTEEIKLLDPRLVDFVESESKSSNGT